jgi:glycerol-3-phosphate acyltransferase PlsY
MLWIIFGIIISYFLGSIPTAYIFGRLLKGIDIRNFGSGNVGATNALRVLGKPAGITVLLLDMLKGFLAVVFLGDFIGLRATLCPPGFDCYASFSRIPSSEVLRLILGLSCICGHNWTVFLRFKGGKGVATTFGVLLGLAIKIAGLKLAVGLAILTWLVVFIIARIVSVASVITGISLPIYMILFEQSPALIFLSIILSAFIILRHQSNLKRLFTGKEKRVSPYK